MKSIKNWNWKSILKGVAIAGIFIMLVAILVKI